MLKPVSEKLNLPQVDLDILKFWEEKQVFARSIQEREGKADFVFFDGPPEPTACPTSGT